MESFSSLFTVAPGEKPLDVIKDDGGLTSLFRRIAVIGDSLASGDLESIDVGMPKHFDDFYDISWGQYLARMSGVEVLNFTRGAMTAKWYCDSFADERVFWDKTLAAPAYVIALGVNDLDEANQEVGSVSDVAPDWHFNKPTFAGYIARIIQHYKEISPDAVFFLTTIPQESPEFLPEEWAKNHVAHRQLMYSFSEYFANTYVIDLYEHGPVQDAEFHKLFYTGGHLNSAGYYLFAKVIGSYIDYIVRKEELLK